MNPIVLSDELIREDLFPFTLTRSAVEIRLGILTLREKWEQRYSLSVKVESRKSAAASILPANLIPTETLVEFLRTAKRDDTFDLKLRQFRQIQYPWHIFKYNGEEIIKDYQWITQGRLSQPISSSNKVMAQEAIFIEQGAKVENAMLNATTGPIYIGTNSEIMEGAIIRGPFALCEGGIVKMGSTIYGATTVGPYSVVGGEVKNSVIFGYSNKAHHGYLGDSVIGYWCNLGAGSTNSNLQNNAREVKVWNEYKKQFIPAGYKCGLLMGDYSRSGINTSFNTGTVTGVSCNIFGAGLTPRYIPSFSWGMNNLPSYSIDRALEDIDSWKKLKNERITDVEIRTLKHIFEQLSKTH
jgi:UDP-N-acetylglucosamine diphosphorylase/glucosamine-1-phosphate N-acetyltransferase